MGDLHWPFDRVRSQGAQAVPLRTLRGRGGGPGALLQFPPAVGAHNEIGQALVHDTSASPFRVCSVGHATARRRRRSVEGHRPCAFRRELLSPEQPTARTSMRSYRRSTNSSRVRPACSRTGASVPRGSSFRCGTMTNDFLPDGSKRIIATWLPLPRLGAYSKPALVSAWMT